MKKSDVLIAFAFVFVISFLFSSIVNKPKPIVKNIQSDVLPLEENHSLLIELVDGKRFITFTYEDLEFILDNRRNRTDLLENIKSLFARMNDEPIDKYKKVRN